MWLFELLAGATSRLAAWFWLDDEVQRADVTGADLIAGFAIALGVLAIMFGLAVHFLA